MSLENNLHDYLRNENPYAFLRDYDKNEFKEPEIQRKLDGIHQIQPKFIPCIMDKSVFSEERKSAMNYVIRNRINESIMDGTAILDKYNIPHDIYQHKILNTAVTIETHNKAMELKDIGFNIDYAKKHKYNMGALSYILEVFRSYLDYEGMEDVVLNILRLKSINKQKILREKVWNVVKTKIDEEVILNIDIEANIKEDSLEDAKRIVELDRKLYYKKA